MAPSYLSAGQPTVNILSSPIRHPRPRQTRTIRLPRPLPAGSVIGHLSPLPTSMPPLSLSSATLPRCSTGRVGSHRSPALPPSSCIPRKLLRQICIQLFLGSRSGCPSALRLNWSNRFLLRLRQWLAAAHALWELGLEVGRWVAGFSLTVSNNCTSFQNGKVRIPQRSFVIIFC